MQDKTEYMRFNETGDISTLNGSSLKLVDKFIYLRSSVSSTETEINTRLAKACTTIDRLSVIWMSNLTDKIKRCFFQGAVVSILLYGCTTWTLTKRTEKKLYRNYTTMLWAILNKSKRQHPTYHHHHHRIVLAARISLTLSRHSSLSFIALGRSSGQQSVSSHSCWMYVRAGRPAFARPCVGIHKSTSLMSSSLLLQQCPACLVRLTWIVFVIGGRWPYSWCLVGCCCQDLFRIARSILV